MWKMRGKYLVINKIQFKNKGMFTGIVHNHYPVTQITDSPGLRSFAVALPAELLEGLQIGASVSVAGVCLTVTRIDGDNVFFDAMSETLQKTTLGELRVGDTVNIQRSFRAMDEIGGHIVSGHVDNLASITEVQQNGGDQRAVFRVEPRFMEYILPKGFIALDGCSLTVVDVGPDWFSVAFIPETLRRTTFGQKKAGDKVNVEIDRQTQMVVETVKKYMQRYLK